MTAVDVNDSTTGSDLDADGDSLSYTCSYTHNKAGGTTATTCSSLPGTVSYSESAGTLSWTPSTAAAVGSATTIYTFSITATDGTDSASISFTVTVTPIPAISVSVDGTTVSNAGTYLFGIVSESITYSATSFTVSNSGANDLTISSLGVAGNDSGDFTVASAPVSVVAGSSQNFSVLFDPSADSATANTTTLSISSNATNTSTYSITLSGLTKWLGGFVDGDGALGVNYDPTEAVYNPTIVSFNSKLYAAWREEDTGTGATQIRVAVYNGNDSAPSWSFVDGNAGTGLNKNTSRSADAPAFAVLDSKLYLSWIETDGTANQIRATVYNGNDSSPSWSFVDGNAATGLNKNTAQPAGAPMLTGFSSKLYLSWYEHDGTANQIRVAVYNGNDSSPSWAFVDGNAATGLNKDTTKVAAFPRLTEFNSKLYLMWTEANAKSQIRVAVYNGNDSSPSWSFIDGNGADGINKDTTKDAYYSHFGTLNDKLYAIWCEQNAGGVLQTRVVVYNGNDSSPSWTFVDGNAADGLNKDTSRTTLDPNFVTYKGKLYASWIEDDGTTYQVRLRAFNGNDSSPSWYFVDGNAATGLNKNTAKFAVQSTFISLNNKLYGSWYECTFLGPDTGCGVRFRVSEP